MSLIETLAAELSPAPAVRGWLIRSWLSPAPDRGRALAGRDGRCGRRDSSVASRGFARGSGPNGPPRPASGTGGSRGWPRSPAKRRREMKGRVTRHDPRHPGRTGEALTARSPRLTARRSSSGRER